MGICWWFITNYLYFFKFLMPIILNLCIYMNKVVKICGNFFFFETNWSPRAKKVWKFHFKMLKGTLTSS